MEDLEKIVKILEGISYCVVIIGLPVAIFQFFRNTKKEREKRELDGIIKANEQYWEFLTICFENPSLDIFDISDEEIVKSFKGNKKELIGFTMLVALFERVFVMTYKNQNDSFRERHWSGWQELIDRYCQRQGFHDAWKVIGVDWDKEFLDYMNSRIDNQL